MGEEVTPLDAAECGHLQGKDNEYFLKPENCNMLESQEMIIPCEGDSHQEFEEILDGKNVQNISHVNTLENPYSNCPRSMDHAGVSVEELTLRNFNGSNLAVVGTSTNLGRVQTRQNQWQHLYQLASGSGSGSSRGNTAYRDNGQRMTSGLEDVCFSSFPEFLAQKACNDNRNEVVEELTNSENRGISGNAPGSIRTKILSKSGFSEFFVKNTLKGKGIICKGPPQAGFHLEARERNNTKLAGGTIAASDTPQGLNSKIVNPSSYELNTRSRIVDSDCGGVNMREWLKVGRYQVKKLERLYIFRQIVELVDQSHSQGAALQSLRPSCFRLLPSNKVMYLGSPNRKEISQSMMDQDLSQSENSLHRKRPVVQNTSPSVSLCAKKQKFIQDSRVLRQWLQFPTNSGFQQDTANASHINIKGQKNTIDEFDEGDLVSKHGIESKSGSPLVSNAREQMTYASEQLEEKWYTSPEEHNEGSCKILSNIYSLGVFLFEVWKLLNFIVMNFYHNIFILN